MKKPIIITSLIVISLIALYQFGVISSLTYFLLAGIVPGTTYEIPSTFMLLFMMSAAWVLALSFLPARLFRATAEAKPSQPKRRLPKRRYERI